MKVPVAALVQLQGAVSVSTNILRRYSLVSFLAVTSDLQAESCCPGGPRHIDRSGLQVGPHCVGKVNIIPAASHMLSTGRI